MLHRFILKRVAQAVVVLIGASILSFFILRMIPGDPAMMMLGESATPQQVAELRLDMGLDRPLWVQYGIYVNQAVHGDFGKSLRRGMPALGLVMDRLPATGMLALASIVLAIVVAVPAGIISAVRRNSPIDSLVSVFALAGQSMPTYWLGLLLMLVFAVKLRVLPTSGYGSLRNLVLPAVTLAAYNMALIARLVRASLLEVMEQDYIRTARAKGLKERVVIYRHALKNALIPVITVVGLQIGNLLGGAVITETVFSWPGIGFMTVLSIGFRDYPVVQAAVMISAVIFVVINLLIDLFYVLIDPRIMLD